jgi:plastocyanin
MDRERLARPILIVGAVITVAASAFAVGAAISSSDEASDASAGGPASSAASVTTSAAQAGSGQSPVSAAATATSAPPATATARVDITIAGFQFTPQEARVQAGTEVVWTNSDSTDHSVVSTDGKFQDSEALGEGDSYSFVFTTPGTYAYFCGFHNSMTGTIVVEG